MLLTALDPEWPAAAVVDCGMHTLKCGLAGATAPVALVPSLCSTSRAPVLVGDDALAEPLAELRDPLTRGDAECLLLHALESRLCVAAAERPLFLATPGTTPFSARELAESAFETLGVRAVRIEHTAPLAAAAAAHAMAMQAQCVRVYTAGARPTAPPTLLAGVSCSFATPLAPNEAAAAALGAASALVIDIGEGSARVTPVLRGVRRETVSAVTLGGRVLTNALASALRPASEPREPLAQLPASGGRQAQQRGAKSPRDLRAVAWLKEKRCYVSADVSREGTGTTELMGQPALRTLRFRVPELLFASRSPAVQTLPQVVASALEPFGPLERLELLWNVVLCGGGSALPGLPKRLARELQALLGESPNVVSVAGSDHLAWRGASLCALPGGNPLDAAGPKSWLTRRHWREYGPRALSQFVHQHDLQLHSQADDHHDQQPLEQQNDAAATKPSTS